MFEIEPSAASVVRRIYHDYAAGLSPAQIADALNREHVPPPPSEDGEVAASNAPAQVRAQDGSHFKDQEAQS